MIGKLKEYRKTSPERIIRARLQSCDHNVGDHIVIERLNRVPSEESNDP